MFMAKVSLNARPRGPGQARFIRALSGADARSKAQGDRALEIRLVVSSSQNQPAPPAAMAICVALAKAAEDVSRVLIAQGYCLDSFSAKDQ
jgi:hypothetical protein